MVLRQIQKDFLNRRPGKAVLRLVRTATLAGALATPAIAADAPSSAPPAGISHAALALDAVLDGNRRALGRRLPGTPPTRVESWSISYGSLMGSRNEWRNGADYRMEQTLGPDRTGWGVLAGRHWSQNANGQIAYGEGIHRRDEINVRALHSAANPGVTLLGQVATPVAAYVVRVFPPGGRLQYVFFDKSTYLIDRIEELRAGRRVTTTYSDYRTTAGLTQPWRIHSSDGFETNDDVETLQSLSIGQSFPQSNLAVPSPAPPLLVAGPAPVPIPGTIVDDRIVVRTRIGGHSVDFLLDSGADGIVIDNAVVAALGIKQYGRMTSETAGTYVESAVVLPKITIGSLSMENAHATSLPFEQWANGTPIAGLFGFDVISGLVWHLDYEHGRVEAIDPAAFTPPAGARAIAVTFDDNVPAVRATIAGASSYMIVDTGADRSALFSSFMQAHTGQVSDRGLGAELQAASPFVSDLSGVGGTVDYRPLQAGPFAFGPWTFPKWLFYVTQNAPSFEFEDYDGLVGQDVLRNFDVYLDYPHAKIYLVPNDRFHQRWP